MEKNNLCDTCANYCECGVPATKEEQSTVKYCTKYEPSVEWLGVEFNVFCLASEADDISLEDLLDDDEEE